LEQAYSEHYVPDIVKSLYHRMTTNPIKTVDRDSAQVDSRMNTHLLINKHSYCFA